MKIKSIKAFIFNSADRFTILSGRGLYDKMDDETYIRRLYKLKVGKDLDLEHPQAFNEKLQWLKFHDRKDIYITMVDKYEVKKYVSDIIGKEYIIPTLGVWDHFDEIDFRTLPDQFVLKCTHDSGGIIIVKDKAAFDRRKARRFLEKRLKRNYYYGSREWSYKNVKPRIIAEKYIDDISQNELIDYKFMCFNGKHKCTFTCTERFSRHGLKVTFFDESWERLPFIRHYPASKQNIRKPDNYEKMVEIAEILSKDIPFLRVDFYEVNGNLYFGELTFYPGSGFEKFYPEEWDYILGSWLELPQKENV